MDRQARIDRETRGAEIAREGMEGRFRKGKTRSGKEKRQKREAGEETEEGSRGRDRRGKEGNRRGKEGEMDREAEGRGWTAREERRVGWRQSDRQTHRHRGRHAKGEMCGEEDMTVDSTASLVVGELADLSRLP